MNILDLAYQHSIDMEFDGDFDGGNYYVTLNYLIASHRGVDGAQTKITLSQEDINRLHEGAKKLVKLLEKHVTKGY